MSETIVVTITCTLTDRRALYAAALDRALADGIDAKAARKLLRHDPGACARYLLDPGQSPPGLAIEDSAADVFNV
jgi:hypothetical protein